MKDTEEYFFTIKLTENEHYIANDLIQDYCNKHNLKLQYYRKFKNGHVPMEREVKIVGKNKDIGLFMGWLDSDDSGSLIHNLGNYHRDNK